MGNILVCVTQQKTCERLIRYGKELADGSGGDLMVVHIAQYDLSKLAEEDYAESLEYLYQKALEYGANLTLIRSGNVPATLASMINKNEVSTVVMGETRKETDEESTTHAFTEILHEDAQVIVVPEEEDDEEDA